MYLYAQNVISVHKRIPECDHNSSSSRMRCDTAICLGNFMMAFPCSTPHTFDCASSAQLSGMAKDSVSLLKSFPRMAAFPTYVASALFEEAAARPGEAKTGVITRRQCFWLAASVKTLWGEMTKSKGRLWTGLDLGKVTILAQIGWPKWLGQESCALSALSLSHPLHFERPFCAPQTLLSGSSRSSSIFIILGQSSQQESSKTSCSISIQSLRQSEAIKWWCLWGICCAERSKLFWHLREEDEWTLLWASRLIDDGWMERGHKWEEIAQN